MIELANETQTARSEKTDLKTQLAEVAERIRTMRDIMGLSEEEMAQRTGVTVEEYRRCENGESDFSFTFIYKCAERFGIDPTDLIKGVSPTLSTYTISRRGEGLPITRRHGFKYLNLAPLFKQKTAEPFYVTMPYNETEQNVAIKLSTIRVRSSTSSSRAGCACRSARTSRSSARATRSTTTAERRTA